VNYQKPAAICEGAPARDGPCDSHRIGTFVPSELQAVEEAVRSQGVAIRRMRLDDIPGVLELVAQLFEESARPSRREVYKNVRWGGPGNLVAQDGSGSLVGFYLCTSYAEGVSLGVMMGVARRMAGRRLALALERRSFLETMAFGSRLRYGGVRPDNFRSLHVLLNQVGYVGEEFVVSPDPALSRILITLPQTPRAYVAESRWRSWASWSSASAIQT